MISNKKRRELEKRFNHLYKRYGNDWGTCFYCGENAYLFDHCPPLTYTENLNITKYKKGGGDFKLLSSCEWCNRAIGKKAVTDLKCRMEYIYEWYTQKAKYYDNLWEEDELASLGRNLRSLVEGNISKMRFYQEKADKVAQLIIDRYVNNE